MGHYGMVSVLQTILLLLLFFRPFFFFLFNVDYVVHVKSSSNFRFTLIRLLDHNNHKNEDFYVESFQEKYNSTHWYGISTRPDILHNNSRDL